MYLLFTSLPTSLWLPGWKHHLSFPGLTLLICLLILYLCNWLYHPIRSFLSTGSIFSVDQVYHPKLSFPQFAAFSKTLTISLSTFQRTILIHRTLPYLHSLLNSLNSGISTVISLLKVKWPSYHPIQLPSLDFILFSSSVSFNFIDLLSWNSLLCSFHGIYFFSSCPSYCASPQLSLPQSMTPSSPSSIWKKWSFEKF